MVDDKAQVSEQMNRMLLKEYILYAVKLKRAEVKDLITTFPQPHLSPSPPHPAFEECYDYTLAQEMQTAQQKSRQKAENVQSFKHRRPPPHYICKRFFPASSTVPGTIVLQMTI